MVVQASSGWTADKPPGSIVGLFWLSRCFAAADPVDVPNVSSFCLMAGVSRLGAVCWVVGVDDFVAGVGFDDDVAAVVDVVVAVWAGQTHFVDVR